MAIIQEYMNGPCKITVHDDCIVKTPEEVQEIVDRVSRIVLQEEFRRHLEAKRKAEDTVV